MLTYSVSYRSEFQDFYGLSNPYSRIHESHDLLSLHRPQFDRKLESKVRGISLAGEASAEGMEELKPILKRLSPGINIDFYSTSILVWWALEERHIVRDNT